MEILEIKKATDDNTVKFIYLTEDGLIAEASYINKNDGKDIICIPCQTACQMKCKFCHVTDVADKLITRNLRAEEMADCVNILFKKLDLQANHRCLLVSFMGCGEPLCNSINIGDCMTALVAMHSDRLVRFGIATSLPKGHWHNFFNLAAKIKERKLLVKMHLSLHYTNDALRAHWMPNALEILPAISALEFYQKLTGNSVEIHYALIEGLNDTEQDAILLTEMLQGRGIPVKFLFYNEKPSVDYHASSKKAVATFAKHFDPKGVKHEYYIPPGISIAASCGMLLMDYYVKYSKNKINF